MEEGLASKLTLFADDNLLLSISNCHIINSQILNSDLEKLEAWAQQWIVSFSALKTNSMVVNYRNITPPNNLKMYNQELQNIPYSKHLGVTLQQNLKWDKHFEEISIKANKRLDIQNLLSFKLSRNSLEILYFTFVRSVLEYSNELFSNATKENLELFDKIQKRAGKIVSGAIRGTSSIKIYTELSWESLQSRRENKMIILYSDILHDRTPSYLKPIIPQTVKETSQGRYNLRNNSNINQTNTRTETFRKSYIPATTQFWNNLDDSIKDLTSKESLKQILKRNKPNTKSYYNIGKRKLNIILARIRMECSELSHHLFTMNIRPIDNPLCTCGRNETTNHFFIECPQYHLPRVVLIENLTQININFNLETLLHGTRDSLLDLQLISLLDTFITATKRFALLTKK